MPRTAGDTPLRKKRGLNAIGHKRIFPGLVSRAKEEDKRKKTATQKHTRESKSKKHA